MLVNFIGCPASGKTTTAASVFAKLKETGTPAEFIAEYARQWIARKRLDNPGEPVKLDDDDQYRIMLKQYMLEKVMTAGNNDAVVIADASPLLALLYMSDERHQQRDVQDLIEKTVKNFDMVCYCPPLLQTSAIRDPNRIHTYEEALALDAKLPHIFKRYAPHVEIRMLTSSIDSRTNEVLGEIFNRKLR